MDRNAQQIRLIEAVSYLKRYKSITQAKLAELMQTTPTTISRNINQAASRAVNTEFLIAMNDAAGGIFNIDYIVNGRGELLDKKVEDAITKPQEQHTPNIIELYAQLIKEVEALRTDITAELTQVREIRAQLNEEREQLQSITSQLTLALSGVTLRGYHIDPPAIPQAAEDNQQEST